MLKKGKLLRALAVILVLSMLVTTLFGCTSKGNTPSSSQGSTKTVKTLSCFINETWYDTTGWKGIIPDAITAKTGVSLKITIAADANQLGLMIAANSLPDIVFSDSNLSKMSNPNISYAWQDLIPKYAPSWKPDAERIKTAQNLSNDGKYYTLLSAYESTDLWRNAQGCGPTVPMLFVRQDMMDKLGDPPLNNVSDFENVLALVKQKYPNMIPILLAGSPWFGSVFKNWFGAIDVTSYQIADGKMEYHISDPQYKVALQFINSLYQKGYFSAENFTYQTADTNKVLASNNAMFYSWCTSDPDLTINPIDTSNDGHKWVAVKNLGGDETLNVRPTNGWAGNFITKNCKDPATAIKFYQFMYSDAGIKLGLWGREGIDWTPNSSGAPVYSADMTATRKLGSAAVNAKYNCNWLFGDTFIIENMGSQATSSAQFQSILTDLRSRVLVEPQIMWCTPKDGSNDQITQSKLDSYITDQETKVELSKNDAAFNQNFTDLMNTANQMGLAQLNTDVNAAYQKVK